MHATLSVTLGFCLLASFATQALAASMMHGAHQDAPAPCQPISVHCGQAPTGQFDEQGRFWVVFTAQDHIYLSHRDETSSAFSQPTRVTPQPEAIYNDGENRPKLALGAGGEIYLSWTRKGDTRFSGDIRFSHSLDGGNTFFAPVTINDDALPLSHRFEALEVDTTGHIYLAWLDKRDKEKAIAAGGDYPGSALYYSYSKDRGASFSRNRKLADHTCECCRIATTTNQQGGISLLWRHIFKGGVRDHALIRISESTTTSQLMRASYDDWQIDACPHHGPAITQASLDHYDIAWFTSAPARKGLFYARLNAATGDIDRLHPFSEKAGSSHPHLLRSSKHEIYAVWKFFNGEATDILLTQSQDDAASWQTPIVLASTQGNSDHPFLIENGQTVYLSWHTATEGFRLLPIASLPEHQR